MSCCVQVEWRRTDSVGAGAAGGSAVQRLSTADTMCTLTELFPGAVYEISVRAVSHDLRSDPHTVTKPTRTYHHLPTYSFTHPTYYTISHLFMEITNYYKTT